MRITTLWPPLPLPLLLFPKRRKSICIRWTRTASTMRSRLRIWPLMRRKKPTFIPVLGNPLLQIISRIRPTELVYSLFFWFFSGDQFQITVVSNLRRWVGFESDWRYYRVRMTSHSSQTTFYTIVDGFYNKINAFLVIYNNISSFFSPLFLLPSY